MAVGAVWLALGPATRAAPVSPPDRPALPIELPANFQRLAEPGAAARAAAAEVAASRDDVAVTAELWGDPAMGCYALIERVDFPASAADVGALLRQALGAATEIELGEDDRPAAATPGAPPDPDAPMTFTFTSRAFRGTGHLRFRPPEAGSRGIDLIACFHNQRYRQRSRKLCAALLEPWIAAP